MPKRKRTKGRTRPGAHSRSVQTATKTTSTLDRVLGAHNVFAILALIFGTCFLISTPPFQVPDEIAHFDRVFRLAEGGVTQKLESGQSGDYVPASIASAFWQFRYLSWHSNQKLEKEKIFNALRIPLNQEKRKFDRIDAGNYFYFSYIPQLPAVLIGKLFGMHVLTILYLGRLFGLVFYVICVRYAIALIPEGKWLLLALALMPICLAQAGSYNADCVLYSFSFLGVALLMKTLFDPWPLTLNKETVLLLSIFLVLGVLKVLYLPLVLLVFVIPRNRFKDRLQYYIITSSVVVLSAALAFAWLKISSSYGAPADPNTDAPQKLASLIHNPFLPVRLVTETMNRFPWHHYRMTIGILGYADTRLPDGVYTAYAMTILFLAMIEGCKKFRLSIYSRILFWVVGIVIFLGAFVALWLLNPRQNGFVVTGVQGRYLIPGLFCFLLAFQGLSPFQLNLSSRKVLILLLFLLLFTALFATQMTILDRYYG
jgi:uncharacterized membrane protein